MLDTSQWREAPSHCTHSTEAADAAAESRFPRTSANTSAGAADELLPRKVDELSDATGIVRNDLSTTTAGAESCQSRFCPLRLRTQSFLQLFMPSFSISVYVIIFNPSSTKISLFFYIENLHKRI
jgi:hypothetical protein